MKYRNTDTKNGCPYERYEVKELKPKAASLDPLNHYEFTSMTS